MAEYHVDMTGEDGTLFVITVEAGSHEEAYYEAQDRYPEACVGDIKSNADLREEEMDRYHRMQAIYDNPDLDDY